MFYIHLTKTIAQGMLLLIEIEVGSNSQPVRFYTGEKNAMELYLYEDLLKAESQDDLLEKTQRVVEKLEYETNTATANRIIL